jgi:hypothetical protein
LSGVLAVCIAYALAMQALMASVGLGMSAVAAPGQPGFVICHFASTPAPDRDRQRPNPEPQCPFCFVAAQSAGHVALVGEATALPAYTGLFVASLLNPIGAGIFVPQFRRTTGDPRAPPAFSV